jgi:thymidylate synthase (FAD)
MVATQSFAFEDYTLALENGIPAEDARYILPIGTVTNLMMKANFAALLHICDERLCTQAQWEIRKLFAKIKTLVEGVEPILGNMLGPKCMPQRAGLCNEAFKDWQECAVGKVRPHKILLESWVHDWQGECNAGQ